MASLLLDVIILLLAAFVPSLVYLVWIRNTERFSKEPYGRLLRIFIFGATMSVFVAVLVEFLLIYLLDDNIDRVYDILGNDPNLGTLLLAVVIAPFVEEFAKALGILGSRKFIKELEDGIVFGAAAGLGFAATENLLYESTAYFSDGVGAFITITVIRSLSSALLHASASAVAGLGIARSWMAKTGWTGYYLLAVLMHALFNLAASAGPYLESDLGDSAYLAGLMAAIIIAAVSISMIRSKIRALDSGTAR